MPVKTLDKVRRELKRAYRSKDTSNGKKRTWRDVARLYDGAAPTDYRLSPAMVNLIVEKGHEPFDPRARKKLGMSVLKYAPCCVTCGEVHLRRGKRCPNSPRPAGPVKPKTNWKALSLFLAGVITFSE